MSNEESKQSSAGKDQAGQPAKAARSGIEKMIVWGVIGAGLLLIVVEGSAWFQHKRAHDGIRAGLDRSEENSEFQVTRKDVEVVLGEREPDLTKEIEVLGGQKERYDVYYFKGLLKERTLCVRYGVAGTMGEPEVIAVSAVIPDEIL